MSPDLGLAKVYLSFMAVPDKKIALEVVKQEAWRVRKALSDKIGKQVRVIPKLNFYLDDSLDYYESINNALKK
jgi:ribosome-binding factor A